MNECFNLAGRDRRYGPCHCHGCNSMQLKRRNCWFCVAFANPPVKSTAKCVQVHVFSVFISDITTGLPSHLFPPQNVFGEWCLLQRSRAKESALIPRMKPQTKDSKQMNHGQDAQTTLSQPAFLSSHNNLGQVPQNKAPSVPFSLFFMLDSISVILLLA